MKFQSVPSTLENATSIVSQNDSSKKNDKITKKRMISVCGKSDGFLHNGIATAKYNALTFLPIFLFEQFSYYSNCFFLMTALLQQIPDVSPTGRYTTIIPFSFILLVSAIKEIYEDYFRHKEDNLMNNAEVDVINRFQEKTVKRKWKDVKVGDLVLILENSFFPADIVLLTSKEPSGLCYVETANLDGETNLKPRTSLRMTDEICSKMCNNNMKELNLEGMCNSKLMSASIECDTPNKLLYEFDGRIRIENDDIRIGPENILLRGAKLRNTSWALGCVIYTGHETKLMMNYSTSTPIKQSLVQKKCNKQMIALLVILIIMCLVSAIQAVRWVGMYGENHWYIVNLNKKSFILSFITFIILYNNLVPISLQVTLEIIRLIQAHFINSDLEMYDEETDTRAMARTSNLNEELGAIRYILSDKTGTLTRNIMEFKKCFISGRVYDDETFGELIQKIHNKETNWKNVREFMVLLAVCHTVIPELDKTDSEHRFTYTASSPDEVALVKGAQKIGFELIQRTPTEVVIDSMGTNERYEILHILEFDSNRKRMSAICRMPNGNIRLYTKGADSIIAKRLKQKSLLKFKRKAEKALCTFANEGLRTLCVAYTDISEKNYNEWDRKMKVAFNIVDKMTREKKLNKLMDGIETNLTLLGATAIEDKLQVGVPETIETLMKAGINIWMLTGDKQETAINIGYSCRLLKDNQALDSYHIINEDSSAATKRSISDAKRKITNHPNDFTLIIDCKSLSFALVPPLQSDFIAVACKCRSVICCRVTPSQKAEVVNAVRKHTDTITLAIGDGANDVAMIRAAHVGIGISGQEGLQAVYASDYAIGQFRFLARLLLVHGSWSLSRICKVIFYSFYKNIVLYVMELWFAVESAWSGQAGFERWSLSLYNLVFTAFPPIVFGIFDRMCTAEMLYNNPELYHDQWNLFNIKIFWFWIFCGIWHSLVIYWLSYFSLMHETLWANGKSDGGLFCFGNIVYTYVLTTVCLKAALEASCWTKLTHLAIWGSIVLWFIWLVLYSRAWPHLAMGGVDMASIDTAIFTTWNFWLGMGVIPFMSLLLDIVVKLITRTCFQSLSDKVVMLEMAKEAERENKFTQWKEKCAEALQNTKKKCAIPVSTQKSQYIDLKANNKVVHTSQIDATHGFSFSQSDAIPGHELTQANVIRMYNTNMHDN